MVNPEKEAGLALVQMAQSEKKTCPTLKWKALVEAVESPVG